MVVTVLKQSYEFLRRGIDISYRELQVQQELNERQHRGSRPRFIKEAVGFSPLRSGNVGDVLNGYVYEKLANQSPINIGLYNPNGYTNYLGIGSILQFADQQSIVWGSGFLTDRLGFGNKSWEDLQRPQTGLVIPQKICAVRGPLTRERILDLGLDCPEIYGDPGYLMPLFYQPIHWEKMYKIGLILHYSHAKSPLFSKLKQHPDCRFISVHTKPEAFIDQIVGCELIVSSSLHGLILADAYGIPSLWIVPEHEQNRLEFTFKFHDYLMTIHSEQTNPYPVRLSTSVQDLVKEACYQRGTLDRGRLLMACPFLSPLWQQKVAALSPIRDISALTT